MLDLAKTVATLAVMTGVAVAATLVDGVGGDGAIFLGVAYGLAALSGTLVVAVLRGWEPWV